MSASSRRSVTRRALRDLTAALPHWSEVPEAGAWKRPSSTVAACLADLVNWASDIALKLTRRTAPEDHEAIERVREYALSWLGGAACPDVAIHDLCTTVAAIMAAIDRDLIADATSADDTGVPRAIGLVWFA